MNLEVSLYSVFMGVLWSSIFILLLLALRKVTDLIIHFGAYPLVVLFLGCFIRMVFPWDIHGFTKPISSPGVYNAVNVVLKYKLVPESAFGFSITPIVLLLVVWGIGTVILLIQDVWDYAKFLRDVRRIGFTMDTQLYDEAIEIAAMLHIRRIRLVVSDSIDIPFVCGLFVPIVCFPAGEYNKKERYYSLLHELAHWKSGDIKIRALTLLFFDLFWWNPCAHLLQKGMGDTLEMRCDAFVNKTHSVENREEYVETLVSMTKKAKAHQETSKRKRVRLIAKLTDQDIDLNLFAQRVAISREYKENPVRDRLVFLFMTVFMAVTLVFSYRYILQPYFEVPQEQYETELGLGDLSQNNSYIVLEPDGTYSIYVEGRFLRHLTSESAEFLMDLGIPVK